MNKKKLVSLCLVLALAITAAIGGTMAYFTDTDNKTNTFTVGGVDIEIQEWSYDEETQNWTDITPADGQTADLGKLEPGVKTAWNKNVYTKNLEDDAYIRNFVAVEDPDGEEGEGQITVHCDFANDSDANRYGVDVTEVENVRINDRYFDVYVCTAKGGAVVESGKTLVSLLTVWLDEGFTNEDAEDYDTVEVYTFSEAIQAAGLTHEAAMDELTGEAGLNAHIVDLFEEMIPAAF